MILQKSEVQNQNDQKVTKINKQKKIKKLLKKISFTFTVPKLICIQNYFQISESAIINQASLRDPEHCTESLLTNTFYFKRIGSLLITDNFLELNLKDIISPKLPINYFIERYRSFGDRELHNMSLMFEKIVREFGFLADKSRITTPLQNKEYFESTLSNYLETVKDKNFIMFYYEPSNLGLSLKKFLFSKKLLELVGLDINQIRDDYIKHKHVFFQIFGCDIYKKIITQGTTHMGNIMEDTRLGRLSIEQAISRFNLNLKTLIHRRKKVNEIEFQEEIPATIKLYKPSFFLTMIEITELDAQNVVRAYPLEKKNVEIIKSSQKIQTQLPLETQPCDTQVK